MFQRILLASDGSECALKAARAAAQIATRFDSTITVVSVLSMPLPTATMIGLPGFEADAAAVTRYTEEVQDSVMKRTCATLCEAGITKFDTRQEVGHPAEAIVRVAAGTQADLIVVGSRGLSGIQQFLLGSTSDRVAHHAHCPVLIVK